MCLSFYYCHGRLSADVPSVLHVISRILGTRGPGTGKDRGRTGEGEGGLTSSSFCLSSATIVSLTTHRCSSRSSIMYSWFSRSIATMMDLTAGSASIRTPAWGVAAPGVSGDGLRRKKLGMRVSADLG